MQKFSVAFAADSVKIARDFLDGSSGIRQEYVQSINRAVENQQQHLMQQSQMWMMQSQAKEAAHDAQKKQTVQLVVTGVLAIATAVFTGGAAASTAATATTGGFWSGLGTFLGAAGGSIGTLASAVSGFAGGGDSRTPNYQPTLSMDSVQMQKNMDSYQQAMMNPEAYQTTTGYANYEQIFSGTGAMQSQGAKTDWDREATMMGLRRDQERGGY